MTGGGCEWGWRALGTTEPRPVLGDGRDVHPVTVIEFLSLWAVFEGAQIGCIHAA